MSEKFFPSKSVLRRTVHYIWASPNSFLGALVGLLGLLTGGSAEIHRGCLEFQGGIISLCLKRILGVTAMTLGHTILGTSTSDLAVVRDHEQVHVRQYERWGPLFIPAYLVCSLVLWIRRRDLYRDNPFEVEAFTLSNPADRFSFKPPDQP